jgi:LmbE family N-acetylglucosaminyl deacetylase
MASDPTSTAFARPPKNAGFLMRGKLAIRKVARYVASVRLRHLKARVLKLAPTAVPAGRAIVIAPHPDDEVFACGGVMAQKVMRADEVHVIFVTRGEWARGSLDSVEQERAGAARLKLAGKALAILGIGAEKVHCLGLKDGAVPSHGSSAFSPAADALRNLLEAIQPEVVFVPHQLDFHEDHIASSQLTMAALASSRRLGRVTVLCFPTWMLHTLRTRDVLKPIRGRAIKVDVSTVAAQKAAAIDAYLASEGARNEFGQAVVGDLPRDFISSFTADHEIYFCW